MRDVVLVIIQGLQNQFFIGLLLYTLLLLVLKWNRKNHTSLIQFDASVIRLIPLLGIVLTTLWLIFQSIDNLVLADQYHKDVFIQRVTGRYWFGFWTKPFTWIGLTQLFRSNKLAPSLLFRLLAGALLLVSPHKVIVILTSFYRDYYNDSIVNVLQTNPLSILDAMWIIISSALVFLTIVLIYQYINQRFVKTSDSEAP